MFRDHKNTRYSSTFTCGFIYFVEQMWGIKLEFDQLADLHIILNISSNKLCYPPIRSCCVIDGVCVNNSVLL